MLSGLVIVSPHGVPASDAPAALVRSLSALVPAVVEGLLRDVAILSCLPGGENDESLVAVAQHAGCAMLHRKGLAGALSAGLESTRGDHLLVLRAGRAPAPGFHQELDGLLRAGVRACLMREEPQTWLARLLPSHSPAAMLVAPRASLRAVAEAGLTEENFAALNRALARALAQTLPRAAGSMRNMQARAIVA
ncbi:MAG: hypothetical protein FJX29_08290 [Alphaproteobacteria bacterium]|nr:hypothetical protein [Alphaproteobacteria bacterium]